MPHDLLELLSARKGHFRLESGHHGDRWLDLDALFSRPKALQPFVLELARKLGKEDVAAVCGPLPGGAFVAQSIATVLDVQFFYTELSRAPVEPGALYSVKYRLPLTQRDAVRDKRIAVVDDVVNAGSAVRATIAALRASGAHPAAAGALVVLGTSSLGYFAEQRIALEHVAQMPNDLWKPNECPLCAAQVPLEDLTPGSTAPPMK